MRGSGLPRIQCGQGTVPDAHDPTKSHAPDDVHDRPGTEDGPGYAKISKRFHENPKEFEEAFAKAWYKLTHRDMGPVSRCLGPGLPSRNCGKTRCRPSIMN